MGTNLLVGYTGVYQDPVSGGYPLGNGYRMYLPDLMRFNSPDSWSPFGRGGVNAYVYCSDDPINQADPSGHFGGSIIHFVEVGILGGALLPLNAVPGVGEVVADLVEIVAAGEEAAAAMAAEGEAANAGLAAATATRATDDAVEEGMASSSRTAEVPAKRPRLEESEMRRSPGPDEPGPSRSQVPSLRRASETAAQMQHRGHLNGLEHSMRVNLNPLFSEGRPTLRELYEEADFERLIERIDQFGPPHENNFLEDMVNYYSTRHRNISILTSWQWREERAHTDRLGRQLRDYWLILDSAWNRNPRNPNRPVPN